MFSYRRLEPVPFLKWAGGKRQLLPEIRAHVPDSVGDYYEPFLGSGAVFFDLRARGVVAGRAHLWDVNPALVNLYLQLRDDPDAVIAELRRLAHGHATGGKVFYYGQRRRFNIGRVSASVHAAIFVYLNRTCFNGLFRVNAQGHFNVPAGSYRDPRILDEQKLRAASEALQGAEIACRDFRALFDAVPGLLPGTLVYLDPPYVPVSATSSFTAYTGADFGPDDQADLARLFDDLARAGVGAILSNSWTPLVLELYETHTIHRVEARRAINSVASSRGPVSEAIIVCHPLTARPRPDDDLVGSRTLGRGGSP